MTTGEPGRTTPDAEHYLDLSDVAEESTGPHFDVVLRGYDRRQVDEHVAGLRRMVAQLRAQLAVRERRRSGPHALDDATSDTLPATRAVPAEGPPSGPATPDAAGTPAETAAVPVGAGGPAGGGAVPDDAAEVAPDMVGAFNDRLRGILQAAEQEAQLVRSRAAESLLAEHAESRAALADLRAQRDTVFDELVRVKGRLDDLVANSGRPSAPPRGPWGGPPRGPYGPPPPPGRPPGGYPVGRPVPPPVADDDTALDADTASETDPVAAVRVDEQDPGASGTATDGAAGDGTSPRT